MNNDSPQMPPSSPSAIGPAPSYQPAVPAASTAPKLVNNAAYSPGLFPSPRMFEPTMFNFVRLRFMEIIGDEGNAKLFQLWEIESELKKEHAFAESHSPVLIDKARRAAMAKHAANPTAETFAELKEFNVLSPGDHGQIQHMSRQREQAICAEKLAPIAIYFHEAAASVVRLDMAALQMSERSLALAWRVAWQPSALLRGLGKLELEISGQLPRWKIDPANIPGITSLLESLLMIHAVIMEQGLGVLDTDRCELEEEAAADGLDRSRPLLDEAPISGATRIQLLAAIVKYNAANPDFEIAVSAMNTQDELRMAIIQSNVIARITASDAPLDERIKPTLPEYYLGAMGRAELVKFAETWNNQHPEQSIKFEDQADKPTIIKAIIEGGAVVRGERPKTGGFDGLASRHGNPTRGAPPGASMPAPSATARAEPGRGPSAIQRRADGGRRISQELDGFTPPELGGFIPREAGGLIAPENAS